MAEIEQASLSLEEGAGRYQLLLHSDHKKLNGARSNSDSQSSEEAGGFHQAGDTQTQTQVGLEPPSLISGEAQKEEEVEEEGRALMELMELEVQADQHQQHHQQHHQRSPGGVSSSRGRSAGGDEERREGSGDPLSRFRLPVDFFHPVAVPIPAPPRSRSLRLTRGLRLTSPATWASLRSPGARNTTLCTQHPSHSDSSLATGSSEGSLQTTLEEGLSFSVSPPRNLDPPFPLAPLPLLFPSLTLHKDDPAAAGPPQGPRPPSGLTLQATRGHQRSQSSGRGSASPGCTREDSMDPSDEDLGIGIGPSLGGCGCGQAGNSEHLSETLSSLSLTSLLSPGSLAPRGGGVKKCSSTGSLEQGGALLSSRGREGHKGVLGLELMDPQGFLANPSMGLGDGRGSGGRRGDGGRGGGHESFSLKSSNQTLVGPRRKNR
ncbi:voltage-dependent T-type calcium channel subunit alpha-1I-like [Gadus macrocephalus]|uniref:voltage-dependent T-type calcium channel subunit alpha-1I-like n=1 Tax=Gadus macrocephalus TaxID=80720 RepID=UPI0028CB413A|nr:voltage-dependent T-type calcium channel subunit alpha-1I-like [Gadus macrocephalus]